MVALGFRLLCLALLLTGLGAEMPDEFTALPERFESQAEVNFYHLNYTVRVDEWKEDQPMTYRISLSRGAVDHYLFDYAGGELHHYDYDSCDSQPLTNKSHEATFTMGNFLKASKTSIFSAVSVLKEFSKFKATLDTDDTAVIRGIDCECYKGNAQVDGVQITARYCGSKDTWQFNGMMIARPVSVELSNADLKIEVHFRHFMAAFSADFEEIFQTPEGLYCLGRKFSPVPEMPTFLNYQQESFADNPVVEWVTNGKVTYDSMLNLMRYEYREAIGQPPFYPVGSMSVVHDFNTGVAYYQDITLGNCSAQPIGADLMEVKGQSIQNITGIPLVELRSPNQLLRLDSNFTFVGKKKMRGLPTHYYIALKEIVFPWAEDNVLNATIGIHFLDPDVKEFAVGRGVDVQTNVPLQLIVSAYNDPNIADRAFSYKETYNFYNFDTADTSDNLPDIGELPAWMYDVHECYNSTEEKHVRITFEGPRYNEGLRNESALFPLQAVNSVRSVVGSGFSGIRVQHPEVDYNDTHVYFTLTILPPPKPHMQFLQVKSRVFTYPFTEVLEKASMEDCIKTCAAQKTSPPCQAVNYCPSTKLCQLSTRMVRSLNTTIPSNICDMATRTVPNQGPEKSTENVVFAIQEAVGRGELRVKLPSPKNSTLDKIFTAVDFDEDVYRRHTDTERELPIVGPHLEQFTQTRGMQIEATRTLYGSLLADECARQCLNDASEKDCIAFTYRFKTGMCSLSSYNPELEPGKVSNSSDALLFVRNFVGRFTSNAGKKKQTQQKGQVVESVNACAKLCVEKQPTDQKNASLCRSFDLCLEGRIADKPADKVCYLSESHRGGDEGSIEDVPACTHYSRSFTVDFVRRFDANSISLSGLKTEYSVSADNCARFCVEKVGEECKGYFYCASDEQNSACGAVNASQSEKDRPSGQLKCVYYDRLFLPDGSQYTSRLRDFTDAPSGVATGLTVFLVILFFLLGGFLTFMGMYFFHKKFGGPSGAEDIRVYFSNKGTSGGAGSA